ncbi:MAG: hypothetical protein ABIG32_02340 [Candidatus Uhrbacteria bacterium]|nr:hypothetical protein [Patescibacteria group bacterium]MBU1907098.1 hypothetical protein [Patescibacteria group bacterium]
MSNEVSALSASAAKSIFITLLEKYSKELEIVPIAWALLNYIHHNPIKHGLVKDWNELESYSFSSYPLWLKRQGRNWMNEIITDYPIENFNVPE